MYRISWAWQWLTPGRRLALVSGLVAALVVAQLVLLAVGSLAARRASVVALDETFVFLMDISEERVLASTHAAERAVADIGTQVGPEKKVPADLLARFHTELVNTHELGALAVTYPNGDLVALRRLGGDHDGFSSYVIVHDESGVSVRRETTYDEAMAPVATDYQPDELRPTTTEPYRRAIATSDFAWSQPEADPWTQDAELWVSRATREGDGAVVAVVSASLLLSELSHRLNELPTGSDGHVNLLGADRQLLTARSYGDRTLGAPAPKTTSSVDAGAVVTPFVGAPDVDTTGPATPQDGDVWGSSGSLRTLERGLADEGVDWVIHLRASSAGLNQGFERVTMITRVLVFGLATLMIALGYVLFRLWRPLTAMREHAVRDPLTGLGNRRDADFVVERMLRTASRLGGSVVIAMLDLDEFKQVNDARGHAEGDRALTRVSEAMVQGIRAGDTAVRWGGDEFLLALLLPEGENPADAVESIRWRAEEALVSFLPTIEGLGVTAGFTVSALPGSSLPILVGEADRALVAGKLAAKGRTYAAPEADEVRVPSGGGRRASDSRRRSAGDAS